MGVGNWNINDFEEYAGKNEEAVTNPAAEEKTETDAVEKDKESEV